MHIQDYPRAYPKEENKAYWKHTEYMKETIICKCCRYPSEINCLTGCKMYDECKNPRRKKKYKIRYTPYPL